MYGLYTNKKTRLQILNPRVKGMRVVRTSTGMQAFETCAQPGEESNVTNDEFTGYENDEFTGYGNDETSYFEDLRDSLLGRKRGRQTIVEEDIEK
ncbi:hypothetical protein PTKIN_Ptkin15bG0108800 [Pterospermum kingtungense]